MLRQLILTTSLILIAFVTAFTQVLEWIGDPEDFLPPGDITIQLTHSQCTNDFDPCFWTGLLESSSDEEMWIWELLPDVHYVNVVECLTTVVYSHTPCSDISGPVENQNPPPELVDASTNEFLTTEVCYTLTDFCNNDPLQYCFNVTVQCGSCRQFGNIYCATCPDAVPPLQDGGCKLCDPVDLANGYQSCTPPCEDPTCPIQGPPQPALLCDSPGFVPHNMSWFAFVASSDAADVEVFIFNCIGAGVQSGIYSDCQFSEPCLGFNVNCTTNGTIDYNANFIVGQTYYLFVDGCNGSECEYEVTVDGLNELVPDDMDAITAYSPCKDAYLTDDFSTGAENASVSGECEVADIIIVCPGESIQFGVIHQGNYGNFPDNDNVCEEYALLDAEFAWSASWGDTYSWNPYEANNGEFIELIEMPMQVGDYTICLDFIEYECYPVIGPKCLNIKVEESSGTYYLDADGDGFGTGAPVVLACPVPAGYACVDGDCDDTNAAITPLSLPPSPNLQCRMGANETIIFSWQEISVYDYTVDYSLMPANLITSVISSAEIEVSGFTSPCQYALLGIEVLNPAFTSCNITNERLACRLSVGSEIAFDFQGGTEFEICGSYPPVNLIALIGGMTNPASGEWQHLNPAQPALGFNFNGSTGTFDPAGLPLGQYPASYLYTNPGDGCTESIPILFEIVPCTLDNDGDGSPAGTDCDDNDGNNYPGNIEICDGQDNNCNGLIDEGFDTTGPLVSCIRVGPDFIEIGWNTILGAEDYIVFVNGVESSVQDANVFVIVGLVPGQVVEFGVQVDFGNGCLSDKTLQNCTTEGAANSCSTVRVEPTVRSNGGALSGPYVAGEEVTFACVVEFQVDPRGQGNNCQWLQGIIPSFGTGWDLIAMSPWMQGPDDSEFLPEGAVQFNVSSETIGLNPLNATENELVYNSGSLLVADDDVPAGWWFITPGGINCTNDGTPNTMWGLQANCGSTVLVTFDLKLKVKTNLTPADCLDDDFLKVHMFAFADGMTGCWPSNSCAEDVPALFNASCASRIDNDGDGSPSDVDCDDNDPNNYPGNTENCDGQDNNCNGIVDEGFGVEILVMNCFEITTDELTLVWNKLSDVESYWIYLDGVFQGETLEDNYTYTGLNSNQSYSLRIDVIFSNGCANQTAEIICATAASIDNDGDGSPAGTDCDDNDPNNYPGNTEICDGQDNDCDGAIDEGFNAQSLTVTCVNATSSEINIQWNDLTDIQTYYVYLNTTYIAATVDNSYTFTGLETDRDYELRVDALFTNGCANLSAIVSCMTVSMVVDNDGDGSPAGIDCDDNDPNNFPGNTERCDNVDNNCNGEIDEGLVFNTYYPDNDRDGYGETSQGFEACLTPPDVALEGGDCNDLDPAINPGAMEIPNNTIDENCDGVAEIVDLDGDGWNSDLDCDDTNGAINPGATEIPGNGIDEDCDGMDGPSATYELNGKELNIFPNPVSDELFISTEVKSLQYEIYSTAGAHVLKGKVSAYAIQLSDLPAGIYLLYVYSLEENTKIVELLIKH